jgi:hypothetical protein
MSHACCSHAVVFRIGGERGYLSIDDISAIYSVTKHPAVVAGKMRKEEALQEFVNSFEEVAGKITLDEWIRYYEEMSAPIESDDYFGAIMAGTWAHLKQKLPDGSKVPAVKFTSRADVELLEFKLKGTIYQKTPPNTNSRRTCELAFRHLDTNGSGVIGLDEFIKALERFGMHVSGVRPGPGGMPRETCQALFNKYDVDGSGNLSYKVRLQKAAHRPGPGTDAYSDMAARVHDPGVRVGTLQRRRAHRSAESQHSPEANARMLQGQRVAQGLQRDL